MRCKCEDFRVGSFFHLYNHVIDDLSLFYEDQDYDFFLLTISQQFDKIPASVFAYCLMPNHYHFLLRQDSDIKIYRAFNYAFISYAKYYNKKYGRKGRIFRSPLQHIEVKDQTYLIQLCKYIHLNPVYANLVQEPDEWIYSNYKEWIKKRTGKLFTNEVHEKYFPDPVKYIKFISSI